MKIFEKYPNIKFCRVKHNEKVPFEKGWVTKPYKLEEIKEFTKQGENYGILCGYGGLIVIDADTSELQLEVQKQLPNTFKVRTGGGGIHFYYFCPKCDKKIVLTTLNNGKEHHWGEVQAKGTQVVGPGSIHPSGIPYEPLNTLNIRTISYEQLINAVGPFMKIVQESEFNYAEEKIQASEIDNLKVTNIWGTSGLKNRHNEYFGEHPIHGSEGGMNFWMNSSKNVWHCFRCNSGGGPLSAIAVKEGIINCSESNRGNLRGNKAFQAIKLAKEKYGLKDTLIINNPLITSTQNKNKLDLWTYQHFEDLKKDTDFIIQDFLYPKTVTMLYSPPGQFKSILALNLALSVATGSKWLNFETKQNPVLYCDKENNDQIIKERLMGLFKGNLIEKKEFPLYVLRRNGDLLDDRFLEQLKEAILEKNIKLIIFDTLHRFADYDENSSNDINRLYTKVFQPFVDLYGVSVIFLHHTTKSGGYRGSGDFLGMVDTSYAIYRDGKTDKFSIFNEKCRAGEIDNVIGEIDFGKDYIKVHRLNQEVEVEKKVSKLKEVTNRIKSMFKEGELFSRKEVADTFEIEEFDYGSIKTISRSLKWLTDNGYLDKDEKTKKYSIILR